MPELFSDDWAQAYMQAWNNDPEITTTLKEAGFSSVVAFGFENDDAPAFVMTIDNGEIASVNDSEEVHWDLRANQESWQEMVAKPPGLMQLGIAYTSRKLRFLKGDYANMIKDPGLAGAFVRSFALMGKIE